MTSIKKIIKNDAIKIITGKNKGTTGKVVKVLPKKNAVLIEGIGETTRKIRPSRHNPRGGERKIHTPVEISNIALIADEKTGKTSRVGSSIKEGKKIRVARQINNKEIK